MNKVQGVHSVQKVQDILFSYSVSCVLRPAS